MAVARRSTPSAFPPSPTAVAVVAVEIPFRLFTDEVLEEELRIENDIALAQAGISLAMSIEDILEFSTEFSSSDVPDIQGEPTPTPESDHL